MSFGKRDPCHLFDSVVFSVMGEISPGDEDICFLSVTSGMHRIGVTMIPGPAKRNISPWRWKGLVQPQLNPEELTWVLPFPWPLVSGEMAAGEDKVSKHEAISTWCCLSSGMWHLASHTAAFPADAATFPLFDSPQSMGTLCFACIWSQISYKSSSTKTMLRIYNHLEAPCQLSYTD